MGRPAGFLRWPPRLLDPGRRLHPAPVRPDRGCLAAHPGGAGDLLQPDLPGQRPHRLRQQSRGGAAGGYRPDPDGIRRVRARRRPRRCRRCAPGAAPAGDLRRRHRDRGQRVRSGHLRRPHPPFLGALGRPRARHRRSDGGRLLPALLRDRDRPRGDPAVAHLAGIEERRGGGSGRRRRCDRWPPGCGLQPPVPDRRRGRGRRRDACHPAIPRPGGALRLRPGGPRHPGDDGAHPPHGLRGPGLARAGRLLCDRGLHGRPADGQRRAPAPPSAARGTDCRGRHRRRHRSAPAPVARSLPGLRDAGLPADRAGLAGRVEGAHPGRYRPRRHPQCAADTVGLGGPGHAHRLRLPGLGGRGRRPPDRPQPDRLPPRTRAPRPGR